MADQLTLAFDTSAAHCAAALLLGDTIVATRVEDMAKGQAERLMPLLEEVLTEAGKNWSDLDRIGVGIGPGNFTGIRVSVSAARGLAVSLGVPAIGVSALEAMADAPSITGKTLAVIDARQNKAYSQLFDIGGIALAPPTLSLLQDVSQSPDGGLTVVGHDSANLALRLGCHHVETTARAAIEATARIASTRMLDGSRPAPLYLRPADAAPPRDPAPVIL
ncbi:tRNA (adenosine(37)-N6)-threonylcarbamoyltransferase complex dimerization subunit type 1 TsaB [uncultured Litoreibacter sp.]|uniref:tRNA (adenosine(37)-N6)-threonylcarbamoyltransferase complex dimerization subunit type 1 TsaB n=1 Tax=uncultured Litoreibacter sp. TaxID=1392394 RepID=UPI00262BB446|nr:tRNA (adenosine(37)-N6)-threonylcarbamoyltransferase complex dimerization subunit type 1 TsaB [uncultured Litoreibacter sp.]